MALGHRGPLSIPLSKVSRSIINKVGKEIGNVEAQIMSNGGADKTEREKAKHDARWRCAVLTLSHTPASMPKKR